MNGKRGKETDREIQVVGRGGPGYPGRMSMLPGMPKALYLIGSLPEDDKPCAAIVGARMCSGYGRDTAYSLGFYLASRGIQVISGMAVGIDGHAQQGALDAGGRVFAVLASGPDVCYPITNYPIYERLLREGGVISEHGAGTKPLAPYFPSRNRIISALADVVIVVEAKERSGSLITADFALDQGKTVLAVPGRVGDALSEGCNRLISQGAGIVCSPATVAEEFERIRNTFSGKHPGGSPHPAASPAAQGGTGKKKNPLPRNELLSKGALAIRGIMRPGADITVDAAAECLEIPVSCASAALMELVLGGWAEEIGRGRFRALGSPGSGG